MSRRFALWLSPLLVAFGASGSGAADLNRTDIAPGGADFSGIDPGLFIDYVRHRTFVDVNEEGTDAAGATVVAMTKGVRPGAFRMVVNRPFFCAIRDSGTGAILFMGAIEKP